MTDQIKLGHLYPTTVPPAARKSNVRPNQGSGSVSFQNILDQSVLRLSNHAEHRLQQRGIQLKPEQMAKIESAVNQAAAKGAKDSLILMNDMALIVNVKNRTIVTAMDGSSMKDNVFTQIDSAVIIT